ncbi:hypothetical protein ABBQ32_010739 [Trebouxia sp. C0010 RCD-2024]
MTGALPKWEAALDTFDRIKHNFRAQGQIEKAVNSIALDERVLLFRGSDSDIVERLSPYDQVEGVSQAVSPVQQDFVSLMETLKAWMPMLQAQILQQNYQASVSGSGNSQKRKQE